MLESTNNNGTPSVSPAAAAYIAVTVNPSWRHELNVSGILYCLPADGPHGFMPPEYSFLARCVSRGVDILVSACALILTLPLMLLIALIVTLDSPGKIIFVQRRLARSRLMTGDELLTSDMFTIVQGEVNPAGRYWAPRTFRFIKFRTMYADARERFPRLYDYTMTEEEISRFRFKVENDPRVTKAGKWLRELTVDELPNFWNVLTGDMRLAGPRPETPEMLSNYSPDQMTKFTVQPGVSGLAQINGRGRLLFRTTVAFDQEYVKNMSLLLDIKIILKTIQKVIYRHGAF